MYGKRCKFINTTTSLNQVQKEGRGANGKIRAAKHKSIYLIIKCAAKRELMQNTTDANQENVRKLKKKNTTQNGHYNGSAPNLQGALLAKQPNEEAHR